MYSFPLWFLPAVISIEEGRCSKQHNKNLFTTLHKNVFCYSSILFCPFSQQWNLKCPGKKKCIYFLSVPSFQFKKKIPMLYHYLYNPWKLTTWRAIIWVLQGDESWPSELKLKTTWDIVPCFLPMSHIQISSFQCAHLNQAKWRKNRLQCVVRLTTIY